MKTIEERAKEAYPHITAENVSEVLLAQKAYIKGATEQQAIDIVKACDFWRKALVNDKDPYKSIWLALVNSFRREMITVPCDESQVEKKGE